MRLFELLTMRGLAPHGYCLLWDPVLLWLHVVSDAIIGLSYFSIPVALSVFLARRRDIEFGWMIMLFVISSRPAAPPISCRSWCCGCRPTVLRA